MSEIEGFLPKEYRFSSELAEGRELLVDELYDLKEDLGDVINPDDEFSRGYEQLWNIGGSLAKLFALPHEDRDGVRVAMYRAMSFSFQVVERIKDSPIDKLSLSYLTELPHDEDPAEVISRDVERYLRDNPTIASLIFAFQPHIDETYQYGYYIEMTAGLIFMLCEREQAETYLKVKEEEISSRIIEE